MACVVACGDDGQSVWSDTGRAMWRKETHCAEVRGTRARKNTTVEYEQHKNTLFFIEPFESLSIILIVIHYLLTDPCSRGCSTNSFVIN